MLAVEYDVKREDYVSDCVFKRSIGECTICIKLIEKRLRKKHDVFTGSEEGAETAVRNCRSKSLLHKAKDIVSSFKGYGRIQTGYDSLPIFIVRYRENEMYIMTVPYPSSTEMEVDQDFILHITTDILQKVELGAMGKVSFYFKGSNRIFAMTVTEYAIPLMMQAADSEKF
ncbi:MAG: hypothetical protein ACLUOI_05200, partial [Eisenbergiella sp.]